jgi:RNA polymerase sigma factor (sigma-70 family)
MTSERVEAAYRRVHPRLWHALVAYGGDTEVASDAEAEAFAQALRRGCRVLDVDAWVWRCAFRVAAGLLQERRRQLPAAIDRARAGEAGPIAEDPMVVELLAQLGGLSEQQRAVVVLRYVGGFTPSEIAGLLDSSPGSVRVQLHRAHAHLRTVMEDADGR